MANCQNSRDAEQMPTFIIDQKLTKNHWYPENGTLHTVQTIRNDINDKEYITTVSNIPLDNQNDIQS